MIAGDKLIIMGDKGDLAIADASPDAYPDACKELPAPEFSTGFVGLSLFCPAGKSTAATTKAIYYVWT